jgi:hypothetical protein
MSPLPQSQHEDPREAARAEGREILRGFRGALRSMTAAARGALALRATTETVGSQSSIDKPSEPKE